MTDMQDASHPGTASVRGSRTLEQILVTGERPPTDRVLAVVRAVAEALDASHGRGILHRTLSPECIHLRPDGRVTVTGFPEPGEQVTDPSTIAAARPYTAPEVWRSRRIDSRSDQYSLAVIAWEMLSGQRRTDAQQVSGIATLEPIEIHGYVPVHPDLGMQGNAALRTALSGSPHNRYPTCRHFADALAGVTQAVPTPGWQTIYPDIGPARRGIAGPLASIAFFLVVGAVAVHEPWRVTAQRWWQGIPVEVDLASGRFEVALPSQRPTERDATTGTTTTTTSGGTVVGSGLTMSSAPAPSAAPSAVEASPRSGGGATNGTTGGPTVTTAGAGSLSSTSTPDGPSFFSRLIGRGAARTAPAGNVSAGSASANESTSGVGSVRITASGGSPIVLVDGIPRGTAPLTVRVGAGRHTIEIRSVGARYAPARRVIEVGAGGSVSVSFSRVDR